MRWAAETFLRRDQSVGEYEDIIRNTLRNAKADIRLDKGWHPVEVWNNITARWMSDKSTIKIYSSESKTLNLTFNILSFFKPRRLEVYLNGAWVYKELIPNLEIREEGTRIKLLVNLEKGENTIQFYSIDGCQRPSDIPALNSKDNRCLSFALQNVRLLPSNEEKFDHLEYPLKLNLGCGFDIKTGYLNVDLNEFHNPDLVADVTHLDILPSDTYEEILAQDCLEHLKRCNIKPALREWNRLLKKGGILKIRVPNLIGLLEALKSKQSVEEQEWLIQCTFGTQKYNGDYHLSGFTRSLLRNYLLDAGFKNINFKSNNREWVLVVNAEK